MLSTLRVEWNQLETFKNVKKNFWRIKFTTKGLNDKELGNAESKPKHVIIIQ